MARGRRKQIIQSHFEYLSGEHTGEESHGQNAEASELHSSAEWASKQCGGRSSAATLQIP
jgi:hypothetical protein